MKRQNKNSKKLASAASMLLLSTAMLGMATYAWFTMNKEVSVTGMKLQAQATEGIVISGDNKANWKTDWDVNMSAGVALYPTSTDGAASPSWTVAYSKVFDDAYKNQTQTGAGGYIDITPSYTTSGTSGDTFTTGIDGIGTARPSGSTLDQNYILKKTFFIKSTGQSAWAQKLVIDEVTASAAHTTGSGSANLNKALRVLVVVNDTDHFIYAPVTGYDTDTKFKNGTALTLKASDADSDTTVTSIPNSDASAVKVDMYMYYEGEDTNCKSSNITGISVDTLTVSAKFKTADVQ